MFPLLLLSLCCSVEVAQTQLQFISFTPYISPATVLLSYEKMVQNLKVFMYKPNKPQLKCATTVESLFYSSLQNSTYLTQDPEEAHLFFFPFFLNLSTRFLARVWRGGVWERRVVHREALRVGCVPVVVTRDSSTTCVYGCVELERKDSVCEKCARSDVFVGQHVEGTTKANEKIGCGGEYAPQVEPASFALRCVQHYMYQMP
ncbi:hypothetical protein JHK82_038974 [Glycine max]|nr:hypothetical protein JHK86_039153 [Glycine max]KAG4964758.1 hypothetical protein JHK85_039733 [Glycine max]KAG5109751.1 hypothetical protein JHK82_038974 [Glycine max]KAG5121039.1 hypothetical protein JHK84_039379 [Glycine max]